MFSVGEIKAKKGANQRLFSCHFFMTASDFSFLCGTSESVA
jgi:hypothetical protein